MKVCHVTCVHATNDQRIFYKECVSLQKAGYDIYHVGPGESREDRGIHVVGIGEKPASRLKRMTGFAKKAFETAIDLDCDIYHFHDPELIPYALKVKKRGKTVIFDSHESYRELIACKTYLPSFLRKPIASMYTLYERKAFSRFDAVIFPCALHGRHPFEGLCKNTVLIDNYPLFQWQDFPVNDAPTQDRNICYVGSLSEERGITELVKATALANCRLCLAGPIEDEYLRALQELPAYENVQYYGLVDFKDVVPIIRKCQIGMSTIHNAGQYNRYDNFATKVYEYMIFGLPVIITKSQYADSVMKDYCFGVCVDPENVDEIASAVRYLLDNPTVARQMGENGRRAVLEKYNWATEEKKLLALYEELCRKAKLSEVLR